MIMGKKQRALELQVAQCMKENETLKAQIEAINGELASCRELLAKKTLELTNANSKLDDFKHKHEAIITALTEAHSIRERIIHDAKNEANNIAQSAAQREKEILNKASETLAKANEEAKSLLENANADAGRINESAIVEAAEIIESAKIKANSITIAAESAVNAKHEELSRLTTELQTRAQMALEQTKIYAEMLKFLSESEIIELNPSEFDCDREDKCDYCISEGNKITEAGKLELCDKDDCDAEQGKTNNETPCGKGTPCCEESDHGSNNDGESERDQEKINKNKFESDNENETLATASASNVGSAHFETADDISVESQGMNEAVRAFKIDSSSEILSADETNVENDCLNLTESNVFDEEAKESELPSYYSDVAELMRSIYAIEGRNIPEDYGEAVFDVGEGTPLVFDSDDESNDKLPIDDNLEKILKDIL